MRTTEVNNNPFETVSMPVAPAPVKEPKTKPAPTTTPQKDPNPIERPGWAQPHTEPVPEKNSLNTTLR